jgi:hypothetical protein
MIDIHSIHRLVRFLLLPAILAVVCLGFLDILPAHAARALIVGVENYPNPKLHLRGIRDDVRLLTEVLVDKGMFKKDEIRILLDKDATKRNIAGQFKEWLIDGTRPGDTALFYFSGHGTQVWDENGDETDDGKDEVLICWDAKITAPKVRRVFNGMSGESYNVRSTRNLFIDDEIHGLLNKMKGRRVLFVSDSCHSGTVYKNLDPFFVQNKTIEQPEGYKSALDERVAEGEDPVSVESKAGIVNGGLIPGVELVALTASQDSQPAQVVRFNTEPTGFHSVFTWFLIHGLRGMADLNKDGTITYEELTTYLHDSVRRNGYAQRPQASVTPKSVVSQPVIPTAGTTRPEPPTPRPPQPAPVGPPRLFCGVQFSGISSAEVEKVKSALKSRVPPIEWTEAGSHISCRITLDKTAGTYGARLSDATGAQWESISGPSLEAVVPELAGNLRAYYIQSRLAALKNPGSRLSLQLTYAVKNAKHRPPGMVINRDVILFSAAANVPGYVYIMSVDAQGVIHPLYPLSNNNPPKLTPGKPLVLGADESFGVREPFGKEMIFAMLFDALPSFPARYWAKDNIGEVNGIAFAEQTAFLETLWSELTGSGKPKGNWTSQMWLLKSFKK